MWAPRRRPLGGAAASSKLYASDIAPGASLLHECAATCDTEPSCVAFVHDFGSNPHCVFKKSTTTYANAALGHSLVRVCLLAAGTLCLPAAPLSTPSKSRASKSRAARLSSG